MNPPVVSVIIPTYNQADLLKNALQSVLAQDFPDWEALVIDNYSDDTTRDVVAAMQDERITYLRFHNNGVIAASRNYGIQKARGIFIAFLDSDDIWYPAKISRCLDEMKTGKQAVCHRINIRKKGVIITETPLSSLTGGTMYDNLLYTGNSDIATSAVVVEKSCLDRFGNFSEDPRFIAAEDYELWLRLAKNNVRWGLLPDILGEYTIHGKNTSQGIRKQMLAEEAVVISHFSNEQTTSLKKQAGFRKRLLLVSLHASYRMIVSGQRSSAVAALAHGLAAACRGH